MTSGIGCSTSSAQGQDNASSDFGPSVDHNILRRAISQLAKPAKKSSIGVSSPRLSPCRLYHPREVNVHKSRCRTPSTITTHGAGSSYEPAGRAPRSGRRRSCGTVPLRTSLLCAPLRATNRKTPHLNRSEQCPDSGTQPAVVPVSESKSQGTERHCGDVATTRLAKLPEWPASCVAPCPCSSPW